MVKESSRVLMEGIMKVNFLKDFHMEKEFRNEKMVKLTLVNTNMDRFTGKVNLSILMELYMKVSLKMTSDMDGELSHGQTDDNMKENGKMDNKWELEYAKKLKARLRKTNTDCLLTIKTKSSLLKRLSRERLQ